MLDSITGLWIDQNHSAFKMKIVLVLLTSLTFVVCTRIECNWISEFLCGDKCLGIGNNCHCGNDNLPFNQALNNYCCQEPNTSCGNWNGHIYCQGQKLWWNKPCHESCTQGARIGYTMLPCADQKQCYVGVEACMGKPKCTE